MKQFRNRILISLIPCLIAAVIVGVAGYKYWHGLGGFKFGVDLVGGTILVYEVDVDKFTDEKQLDEFKPEELAASLKRRIDPTDLYNVVIRPVSKTRVEIILPTCGAHQEQADRENWNKLLKAARDQWPALQKARLDDIPRGDDTHLATFIEERLKSEKPPVPIQDIENFISTKYGESLKQRFFSAGEVDRIKDLIKNVGNLEFRILANTRDDEPAIRAAQSFFEFSKLSPDERATREKDLETRAIRGLPPPHPVSPEGSDTFEWDTGNGSGKAKYSWVELDRKERASMQLSNSDEKTSAGANMATRWKRAEEARTRNAPLVLDDMGRTVLYSRKCVDRNLKPEERDDKKYEYFVLTRDPSPEEQITGQYLVGARAYTDAKMMPAVSFTFNNTGGNLFYNVTNANRPRGQDGADSHRYLAIMLDNKIVSAPTINSPIRNEGQISGPHFTQKDVDHLVRILKAGALPATLKPNPVSENTIGSTLGADTIASGSKSVVIAFCFVLLFMVAYYRFAGLVASIALLANLLLTIAFMVAVNATFTLPGIAGLVLTVGMAVDANVLIYERLREERERGASLPLAIRNAYSRSFPTVIDTHMTSILTAIILYAVGNDQLKGFGVSLTAGLVISLFTSLYMTRLMFDIGVAKGWVTELRMFRFFTGTSIDFMSKRWYFFWATTIFAFFGAGLFLYRGENGLNIDFVGGTALTAKLKDPIDPQTLRRILDDQTPLAVDKVESTDGGDGYRFRIFYQDGSKETVRLNNRSDAADVKARAQALPDWSVEQRFLEEKLKEGQQAAPSGTSLYFTVRTSERDRDLVQATVSRLLTKGNHQLAQVQVTGPIKVEGRNAVLEFSDYASPGRLKEIVEGLIQDHLASKFKGQDRPPLNRAVEVFGGGLDSKGVFLAGKDEEEDRYKVMRVELRDEAAPLLSTAEFQQVLDQAKQAFADRPQPEEVANFDKLLAADGQTRALYAILASWLVILAYIWLRFGNWTYGLAAVLCLIHDVFFTLGAIATCHYLFQYVPALASALMLQDFKIDQNGVAALLTLIGYSINDKIVVYDRMREVKGKKVQLNVEIVNDSINQALSRTVLTGLSVLQVLLVLYIFGGPGIHLFAFVMLIGLVIGTYSSIYIASPLLLIFGSGGADEDKRPEPEPEPEEEQEPEGAEA